MVPIFLLSLCSVSVALIVTLLTIWYFSFHPIALDLSVGVFGEWLSDFKPEREVFFYRIFVMSGIIAQVIGFWICRSFFSKGVNPALPLQKNTTLNFIDAIIAIVVFLFIFVPSADAIFSRVTDRFFHVDSFFASPGWAVVNGLKLNVDLISQYSILIPVITAKVLHALGHFDHKGILSFEMALGAFYFCAFYFLLRVWIRAQKAAIVGVFAGIGVQMFHPGVFPLVWQFPSATVVRFWWDIPILLALLTHLRTGKSVYLWLASIGVGVALVWTLDAGVYLWLALATYGIFYIFQQRNMLAKTLGFMAVLLTLPFIVAFLILWIIQGSSVFQHTFWHNTFEFAGLFISGFGALPMTFSLDAHQYIAFAFSLVVPILYVLALIFFATACLLKKLDWEHIFICVLSVYGLGLYHYYVVRSAPTSYAAVCLPLVAIATFVIAQSIQRLPSLWARVTWASVATFVCALLILNPLVRAYPGIWNLAIAKEKNAMPKEPDISQDIALITQLTKPDEQVILVSGREVKILMEAKRKPFFYFFAVLYTDQLDVLQFRGSVLWTKERMQRTLAELDQTRLEYAFVEKKLYSGLPAPYYQHFQTLMILISYFHQHYEPVAEGKYLIALKRKNP